MTMINIDLIQNNDVPYFERVANIKLAIPGDRLTSETGYMRGHGTYSEEKDEKKELIASVAGIVETVNKLICVRPFKSRYNGEIGDVVVGRILGVGSRRWRVDIKAKLDGLLLLSSVNLPGGELRRKSEEDEKWMREYLSENDLISAEVQSVFQDGCLSLHTRSLKYGKLGQGVLLNVSPSLIKRCKTHFHKLSCGVTIILGNNGYIWITPFVAEETEATGGFQQNLEPFTHEDHETVARVRNCIILLSQNNIMLYDTTIIHALEASMPYEAKQILTTNIMKEIIEIVLTKIHEINAF